MKRALVHPGRCRSCDPCPVLEQCPMHALFREGPEERPWVDFYRCSGCGRCKGFCPHDAVELLTHPCDGTRRMGW